MTEKMRSSQCSGQARGAHHALRGWEQQRRAATTHSACSPGSGVPPKVETIPARGQHTPPQSHGMTTVLCGEHPRSSRRPSKVTLLWVEGSQPGRAETTAGFAEPRLVPHYCHEDLDPVGVSLCADRSHENRDAWHGSAGSTQRLLQGQSPCPAPARGSATLIPA